MREAMRSLRHALVPARFALKTSLVDVSASKVRFPLLELASFFYQIRAEKYGSYGR